MYEGGEPYIYSAQEVQVIEDICQIIPWIYVEVDKRKTDDQAFIIEIEGKLCDQFVFILIDLGSNYGYFSPDLVDQCQLNKNVHP